MDLMEVGHKADEIGRRHMKHTATGSSKDATKQRGGRKPGASLKAESPLTGT